MLGHLSFVMRRLFEILLGCFNNLEVYVLILFLRLLLADKNIQISDPAVGIPHDLEITA
jgi:hypothetical protein